MFVFIFELRPNMNLENPFRPKISFYVCRHGWVHCFCTFSRNSNVIICYVYRSPLERLARHCRAMTCSLAIGRKVGELFRKISDCA
jgi:hypothetical protein